MSDGNATPINNSASDKGSASPAKKDTPAPAPAAAPKFSEKEEHIMKIAWLCLKSGPPEVDLAKLTDLGGFNTQKTAQNTWGAIKKKLLTMAPPAAEGEEGAATPKPKATPKKRATPAKAKKSATNGAEGDGDDGEATGSPAKKARATPAKKGKASPKKKVKAEEDAETEAEDGEGEGKGEEMEA